MNMFGGLKILQISRTIVYFKSKSHHRLSISDGSLFIVKPDDKMTLVFAKINDIKEDILFLNMCKSCFK